ncbi:MAG: D-glycero-beta-D-manno-heptose 1-phosphate adenylyltransferase [Gloeomargaritaceae cyanobacterium C42_A2020_066]|nr:D-glycero-beta-D-manno-heptose 1-phosphate adenylyltransferase [Gloeomargaritaceae cyanobacterium C42_A2020_066]
MTAARPAVYSLAELVAAIDADPHRWRPLVLTNGCFDLLHVGHVRYLEAARRLGQALVVGLNSDASVRGLKPGRPVMPQGWRAEVLAALAAVDAVVVFGESTAESLVETLRPEVYVKGGDYTIETLPEAAAVRACGGTIALIPFEVAISTSAILQAIQTGVPLQG